MFLYLDRFFQLFLLGICILDLESQEKNVYKI